MIRDAHPLSSYAQKVKIALREKGLACEARMPDGLGSGRRGSALAAVNPRTEAPVRSTAACTTGSGPGWTRRSHAGTGA